MAKFSDKLIHKWLKRPLRLKVVLDSGQGHPVVLLHGIGKTGQVWQHLIEEIKHHNNYRIIVYDLLGFGASPKPDWLKYDTDDHAQAVINSLKKLKLNEPFIIVGHSMGCLIAVRVARLRPDLVKHLILYEMPLYEGLPEKRIYKLRLNAYSKFFNWVTNYQPDFDNLNKNKAQNLAKKIIGFDVDRETWQPFMNSLKNTIMHQTTAEDIKHISTPIDVIYGNFDMFVIKGKTKIIFGDAKENINSHSVRARHTISLKASKLILNRIHEL